MTPERDALATPLKAVLAFYRPEIFLKFFEKMYMNLFFSCLLMSVLFFLKSVTMTE